MTLLLIFNCATQWFFFINHPTHFIDYFPWICLKKRCCCRLKCWDAPRNVDSPENLAALADVFGCESGHPSLCLSGVLLLKGWAPLVLLNTPCMSHMKCRECLLSIWPWLSVFFQSWGFILLERATEKACCGVLLGILAWSMLAQMFDPFDFDLRQQQQQQFTQVSTIMSRTTKMNVKMTKKAPSSTGLALGRLCSLSHILFRMLSVSSLASILWELLFSHARPSPDWLLC